jgi:hypothetical protein
LFSGLLISGSAYAHGPLALDLGAGASVDSGVKADLGANRVELREKLEVKAEANIEKKLDLMEERRATETKKIEDRQKRLEEKKSEIKDKQMERVVKFSHQMIRVHKAAVDRLAKLADRIDSRITKIEAEKNVKLDQSKAKLAEARVKIAAAQTYVVGMEAQVTTITATGTAQSALESVRGIFATSRENLKSAHQALVDVISSIKLGLGLTASTTVSAQ